MLYTCTCEQEMFCFKYSPRAVGPRAIFTKNAVRVHRYTVHVHMYMYIYVAYTCTPINYGI